MRAFALLALVASAVAIPAINSPALSFYQPPAEFSTAPEVLGRSDGSQDEQAIEFLYEKLGMGRDATDLKVTSSYTADLNGVHHVYVSQVVNGLEVRTLIYKFFLSFYSPVSFHIYFWQ